MTPIELMQSVMASKKLTSDNFLDRRMDEDRRRLDFGIQEFTVERRTLAARRLTEDLYAEIDEHVGIYLTRHYRI